MDTMKQKVDHFFENYSEVIFKEGEFVITPEDTISHIYFIKKGSIRMYSVSEKGDEITHTIFREGSFIPIMMILGNIPNKYYFVASEKAVTRKAPQSEVLAFLQENPDCLLDLAKRFAAAIGGLMTRIENGTMDSAHKITQLILYLATKFGEKDGSSVSITLPLTHEDIANWVGITRETVSRQMEKLKKQGVITTHNKKLYIPDIDTLKHFSTLV